jgi:hypothetical protein
VAGHVTEKKSMKQTASRTRAFWKVSALVYLLHIYGHHKWDFSEFVPVTGEHGVDDTHIIKGVAQLFFDLHVVLARFSVV